MTIRFTTVAKIRFLLLILTLGFFATAITIRLTVDRKEILLQDAKTLESRLHKKEAMVLQLLDDDVWMDELKLFGISQDFQKTEDLILDLSSKEQIFVYTYSNNNLSFWSSGVYVPRTDVGIPEGSSMIFTGNGWYQAIKKSEGSFSVLFFIPVKWEYNKTNTYLRNQFSEDLIFTNNLDIANYDDRDVYNIRNQDGQYLFSVKLSGERFDSFYLDFELIMWLLGAFFFLFLINLFCTALVRSGWAWTATLLLGLSLASIRYADLRFSWLSYNFNLGLFDPRYFASSFWFPHLGALLFNIVFLAWFINFIYLHKEKLVEGWHSFFTTRVGNAVIIVILIGFGYGLGHLISRIFYSLILDSDINFDVADILNLNIYSWVGILSLCLGMMCLMLFIGILIHVAHRLIPHVRKLIFVEIFVLAVFAFVLSLFGLLSPAYFLISALILICTWYAKSSNSYHLALIISILLLLATMASLKHNQFQQLKRAEAQKLAIQKIDAVDDIDALALFQDLELEIFDDPIVKSFFRDPEQSSQQELREHLQTVYLSGYLSKYDFLFNEFDDQLQPLGDSKSQKMAEYRDRVISGDLRVTRYFYRGNSSFGNFKYFAQIPILESEDDEITEEDERIQLGTLLLELNHRSFSQYINYPVILADSRIDERQSELISDYAFAFYRNGLLVNQAGRYVYPTVDSLFSPVGMREYKHTGRDEGYSHMAYRPNDRNLIVLSKPEQSSWIQLASLSFFFLVFLLFFLLVNIIRWIFATLNSNDFSLRNLRWSLLILNNRVLYSTRIQMFMVVAVVFTLICTGIITYFSVSRQFMSQQERTMMKFSWDVAKAFESKIIMDNQGFTNEIYNEFDLIAKSIALDVNLYDLSGQLIYTTQPRIYDLRLQSDYINPLAFLHLRDYGRSQYILDESIGKLNYTTAFSAIKDEDYEPIAFLSLPNYASQREFDINIIGLLNTLVNIYALVILVLGLFAVFVANKMTVPLLLVQRSLAKTKIGSPNEPIFWKRNDEIGSLIREYNLMIAELEDSANRIVRSERESAWREMAKQVAHEIKNPLTPLKLGMQHLEKSWKDRDPSFESRFKRFSASFIEQIDSLTHIASEFSDFAKMPDTQLDAVDLIDTIQKSAHVFKSSFNVSIKIVNLIDDGDTVVQGDRDQLLRMFNNLIKNAIEASTNHSKSKILIKISKDEEAQMILVEFSDNGMGITSEARKKLFQPNFTTKSSGTGLGLAFVKKAIEGMQGEITYKTALGRGTTFFIRIPQDSANLSLRNG